MTLPGRNRNVRNSDIAAENHHRMGACQNCGHPVREKFCSYCGQRTDTGRITFRDVWHGIVHFITHLEHGFLHTSRELILRPGSMITGFLAGQRKRHQPPVSYFLIWITAFLLILVWLEKLFGENAVIDYRDYFGPGAATRTAISHLALVLTAIVPVQAFYFWLFLGRPAYNYAECVVTGLYAIGTVILFQVVFSLVALAIHGLHGPPVPLVVSDGLKVAYLGWFSYDLARTMGIRHRILRWVVFLLVAFATFTAWRLFGVPLAVAIFGDTG